VRRGGEVAGWRGGEVARWLETAQKAEAAPPPPKCSRMFHVKGNKKCTESVQRKETAWREPRDMEQEQKTKT